MKSLATCPTARCSPTERLLQWQPCCHISLVMHHINRRRSAVALATAQTGSRNLRLGRSYFANATDEKVTSPAGRLPITLRQYRSRSDLIKAFSRGGD